MRKLLAILAISGLTSIASANTITTEYDCSSSDNYPYNISNMTIESKTMTITRGPITTTSLKVVGQKHLQNTPFAVVRDGRISFISQAIYRFLPIDLTVSLNSSISTSADGSASAFEIDSGVDLGQDSIRDLVSVDHARGTLQYVVDGTESFTCDKI